jgi:hypothetical protein
VVALCNHGRVTSARLPEVSPFPRATSTRGSATAYCSDLVLCGAPSGLVVPAAQAASRLAAVPSQRAALKAGPRIAGRVGEGESEFVCGTRKGGERAAHPHASRPRRPLHASRYRSRARRPTCAGPEFPDSSPHLARCLRLADAARACLAQLLLVPGLGPDACKAPRFLPKKGQTDRHSLLQQYVS